MWHEPEVLIYNTSITADDTTSASAYDVANRRWYQLNVDSVISDEEEWMSEVITRYLLEYHAQSGQNGSLPDFNVINTTREESPITFRKKPIEEFAPRIRGNILYGQGRLDVFPTTTFDLIKRKTFLSCSSDRCVWKGLDCVFKRIEFDEDLAIIEREIRTRETLVRALKQSTDPEATMQSRFHILPILAVVHKNSSTDEVLGILLPYGGKSLEYLAGGYEYSMQVDPEDMEEDPAPQPNPILPVTETQFQGLVLAVWELARVGIVHGDINDRNTLLSPDGQLYLVDLGEVEPDYKSDAYALGSMMLWATDRVSWSDGDKDRVQNISRCLQSICAQPPAAADTSITMEGLEL